MNRKSFLFLNCIFLLFIFTACQSAPVEDSPNTFSVNNAQVYISKIDLDSSGLQIIAKIDTNTPFTLQEFAETTNAVYAINTTPYYLDDNNQIQLLGITKINNQKISEPVEKYSALNFYFNEKNQLRAKIVKNQSDSSLQNYPMSLGGYFTILEDNNVLEYKNNKRSRTAAGLSTDGKYLYLLCVTSNLKSGLSGLSYMECAEILQDLGCSNAIEFDGGHSSAMICPEFGYVHAKKNRTVPAALGFYIPESE